MLWHRSTWLGTIITFEAYYERWELFQQSSAHVSWIGSIQSMTVFPMGAVIGPIYNRGRLKLLFLGGTFGIVFGHTMLSLCHEYWQVVLAQCYRVGIGGGCLFVPAMAVIQPYFSSRLGLTAGIAATDSSLGGILAVHNAVGIICTAFFFGFLCLFVATPPLLSMIRTEDKTKLSSRTGIAYALLGLAVLPGRPGAGGILQHDPSRRDWEAA